VLQCIYFMTIDEAGDRYGSANITENDSSRALRWSEIIGRYSTPD